MNILILYSITGISSFYSSKNDCLKSISKCE